jgi:hypothetical protein
MRCLTLFLILGSAVAGLAQDKEPRVRAKEPTIVTVHGSQDKVETDHSRQQPRSVGGKMLHGIQTGVVTVGRGVAGLTGWLLNTNDDIPRERDRARSEKESTREK